MWMLREGRRRLAKVVACVAEALCRSCAAFFLCAVAKAAGPASAPSDVARVGSRNLSRTGVGGVEGYGERGARLPAKALARQI